MQLSRNRFLRLSTLVVTTASTAACWLGDSLDGFTSGGPAGAAGEGGGAGGTAGAGNTGGTSGTAGTGGGAVNCDPPYIECDGGCVDPNTSNHNCGECFHACVAPASCQQGLCGSPGPSCVGLEDVCGTGGTESCCASTIVPGGSFPMGRCEEADTGVCTDSYAAGDENELPEHVVTVSAFRLDRFEVTVGRVHDCNEARSPSAVRPASAPTGRDDHERLHHRAVVNHSMVFKTLGRMTTDLSQ